MCVCVCVCPQVVSGRQSVPVYRMPIMLSAQRHFSYHDAMLDFSVSHREGEHGDGVPQVDTLCVCVCVLEGASCKHACVPRS